MVSGSVERPSVGQVLMIAILHRVPGDCDGYCALNLLELTDKTGVASKIWEWKQKLGKGREVEPDIYSIPLFVNRDYSEAPVDLLAPREWNR